MPGLRDAPHPQRALRDTTVCRVTRRAERASRSRRTRREPLATGVVLVAEARATTYPQLQRAVDVLRRGECTVLGVILNKQRVRDDLYGYGYGPTANGQAVIER